MAGRTPQRLARAPGDAVVFHGRLVHGAGGNASAGRRRRTLALRFAGEDARWREGEAAFVIADYRAGEDSLVLQHPITLDPNTSVTVTGA